MTQANVLQRMTLPRLLAFAGALALSACAERGDFGRPKETALSHLVAPNAGPTNSGFHFTDDESELRNRAWRFLMPARERTLFDGLIYDAARNGYWPAAYFPETLHWYHEALKAEPFRSPASRYAQLASDVAADRQTLPAFAHVAARVLHADGLRAQAITRVQDLRADEMRDADFRMRENVAVIGWVCYRASMRLQAYRYALEHAFIAMPQMESVRAERVLLGYEQDFEPLRRIGCINRNPWHDMKIDRGIRFPPDGHFYQDNGGVAVATRKAPVRARVRKD